VKMDLRRTAILAAVLAAAGLGIGSGARAAIITFDVAGSGPDQFPAQCKPSTCTLGGTIVIDNSTGAIISEDVTATGFVPSVGPFTTDNGVHKVFGGTLLVLFDADSDRLNLTFPTPTGGSLVGYTGGPVTDANVLFLGPPIRVWTLNSSSLTAQLPATPEPSTWTMMLLGFGGLGFAAWRGSRKAAAFAA
jgi:hypothetical protein